MSLGPPSERFPRQKVTPATETTLVLLYSRERLFSSNQHEVATNAEETPIETPRHNRRRCDTRARSGRTQCRRAGALVRRLRVGQAVPVVASHHNGDLRWQGQRLRWSRSTRAVAVAAPARFPRRSPTPPALESSATAPPRAAQTPLSTRPLQTTERLPSPSTAAPRTTPSSSPRRRRSPAISSSTAAG